MLCHVVFCYAGVSYVVSWLALPCCAEPRRVVFCFVVAFTMRYMLAREALFACVCVCVCLWGSGGVGGWGGYVVF